MSWIAHDCTSHPRPFVNWQCTADRWYSGIPMRRVALHHCLVFCYIHHLRPKYFLQQPVLEHHQVMLLPDQIYRPFTTEVILSLGLHACILRLEVCLCNKSVFVTHTYSNARCKLACLFEYTAIQGKICRNYGRTDLYCFNYWFLVLLTFSRTRRLYSLG
jgi:hypothetical protein